MPLGNLKTETLVGSKTINGDQWNQEYYQRNNQTAEVKSGGVKPFTDKQPNVQTKPKSTTMATKSSPKSKNIPTDDKALLKANQKDLNNKNLT